MVKYCFFCGRNIECKYEKENLKYCRACARIKDNLTMRAHNLIKLLYGVDLKNTTLTAGRDGDGIIFKVEVIKNENDNHSKRQGKERTDQII